MKLGTHVFLIIANNKVYAIFTFILLSNSVFLCVFVLELLPNIYVKITRTFFSSKECFFAKLKF